jgi:hypothetical protein
MPAFVLSSALITKLTFLSPIATPLLHLSAAMFSAFPLDYLNRLSIPLRLIHVRPGERQVQDITVTVYRSVDHPQYLPRLRPDRGQGTFKQLQIVPLFDVPQAGGPFLPLML